MNIAQKAQAGSILVWYAFSMPFRYPLMFVYIIMYQAIAFLAYWILSAYMSSSIGLSLLRIPVQAGLLTIANIFIFGLVKYIYHCLNRKKISFCETITISKSSLLVIFWYLVICFVIEWFQYPGFKSLEVLNLQSIMYVVAFLIGLFWRIVNFYIRPIALFEKTDFDYVIRASRVYFLAAWKEFFIAWTEVFVVSILLLYFLSLFFGSSVIKLIVLIGHAGFVLTKELLMTPSFVSILFGFLGIFFATGMFLMIPLFYMYVTTGKSIKFLDSACDCSCGL
jgi:hypothetical protein